MSKLIGRSEEQRALQRALSSDEAELVAVHGRRRVGKTFLVREFFQERIRFELTGSHGAPLSEQLGNFAAALADAGAEQVAVPASWSVAFRQLRGWLEGLPAGPKRVLFFDELPWLASRRSGFMRAFEHFWNSWASRQPLVVVVCGSAASWMLRHVVRAKRGLHNRVTVQLPLFPFDLSETRAYLATRGPDPGPHQTLELYLALGGVPFYLRGVERGESAAQAIDRLCFSRTGPLRREFNELYDSLFEHASRHKQIVRALAAHPGGMTRGAIIEATGLSTGGGTTTLLDELEHAGFVLRKAAYGHHLRDAVYRLGDEYSRFYLRWMEKHRGGGSGVWTARRGTPAWRAWSGLAFEITCLKHVPQLKRALGIAGIETSQWAWQHRGDDAGPGAQIDLLIDRRDDCINVCELKMSDSPFVINGAYAQALRRKLAVFREVTGSRKALLLTMVTTRGLQPNRYSGELVARDIVLDDLFEERGTARR